LFPGINLIDVLTNYAGNKVCVSVLPQGVQLPPDLIILHEEADHYSLQTTLPCTPKDLNTRLTNFMADKEFIPREEFFARFPLM